MPTSSDLERRLATLFAEKLNVHVPSGETDLIETGLVDSLTFVEFLAQLEQEFGIQVTLEDLKIDHFQTLSRIAGFITRKARDDARLGARGGA